MKFAIYADEDMVGFAMFAALSTKESNETALACTINSDFVKTVR